MSSARAYKTYKRKQRVLQSKAETKPRVDDSGSKGLLKRKSEDSMSMGGSGDITQAIAEYINAIRDL